MLNLLAMPDTKCFAAKKLDLKLILINFQQGHLQEVGYFEDLQYLLKVNQVSKNLRKLKIKLASNRWDSVEVKEVNLKIMPPFLDLCII
jgi:hypothetical protein